MLPQFSPTERQAVSQSDRKTGRSEKALTRCVSLMIITDNNIVSQKASQPARDPSMKMDISPHSLLTGTFWVMKKDLWGAFKDVIFRGSSRGSLGVNYSECSSKYVHFPSPIPSIHLRCGRGGLGDRGDRVDRGGSVNSSWWVTNPSFVSRSFIYS